MKQFVQYYNDDRYH